MNDLLHFILIQLNEHQLLVRLENVTELLPTMALTQVDGQSARCRGLLNLRGEMVPVFADRPGELALSQFILVARDEGVPVGLVVDDLLDIVSLPPDQLARRPIGAGAEAAFCRLEDRLLRVLEPAEFAA